MATVVPFTAYLRLYPSNSGTRWEKIRELEKLGVLIEQALVQDTALCLALPGGGMVRSYAPFGLQQNGVAVKPRFGNTPAQATVVGFFDIGAIIYDEPTAADVAQDDPLYTQPYPDTTVFHAGQALTGPMGATPWACNPNARVTTEVKELVASIEQSLLQGLPEGVQVDVFRIDYQGAIWGDGGYHFPL